MTNGKKSKLTENKGVTITSNDFDISSKIDTDDNLPKSVSVSNVRADLQNVIDTMGPSTPIAIQTVSSDADNEDSIYSTSLYSSIVQVREITTAETPLEDSEMTTYNVSESIDSCCPIKTTEAGVQTHTPMISYPYPIIYQDDSVPPHFCPHISHQNNISSKHTSFYKNGISQTTKLIKHTAIERSSRLASWLGIKNKKDECTDCPRTCDLYKINIENPNDDQSPPRRLVFDLMEEMPKAETKTIGTNTRYNNVYNARNKQTQGIHEHNINNNPDNRRFDKQKKNTTTTERVDIYYFDHGNSEYYRTTDSPPLIMTEYLAERTEHYTKRFWAQIFGTIHIGVSFVTSFILQLVRFLLHAIVRPLTVGLVQLFSDYFVKPCLAVVFNGIVQPPMIFLYNLMTSVRDVCAPVADSTGYFIREVSVMFKAIRLVQVDTNKPAKPCK